MELIKIIEREGRQLVSGRELHEFLEIKTKYKDWFPRMVEYGFEEEIDFIKVAQKRATNNLKNPVTTVIDHAISIDMEKEIIINYKVPLVLENEIKLLNGEG